MPPRKTGDDRPGQPAIFILTGRGNADARFVSAAITDFAIVVPHSVPIERVFQSRNRLLKRISGRRLSALAPPQTVTRIVTTL
jgi:hypothetical protein